MSRELVASGSLETTNTKYTFPGGTTVWNESLVVDIDFDIRRGIEINATCVLPYGILTSITTDRDPRFDLYIYTESSLVDGPSVLYGINATNYPGLIDTIKFNAWFAPDWDGPIIGSANSDLFATFNVRILVHADKILCYANSSFVGEYSGYSHDINTDPFVNFYVLINDAIWQVYSTDPNPFNAKGSINYSVYSIPYYSDGSEYSEGRWTDFVNCGERA